MTESSHVFLSYCREDRDRVAALRQALIEAGIAVWWDGEILPGQNWRLEIKRALNGARALIACLSANTAARARSGIYPELRDAIGLYRQRPPGQAFIIPVRFDDCPVPDMEIDSTTDFGDLQFVDLFPENARPDGIDRLIRALQ